MSKDIDFPYLDKLTPEQINQEVIDSYPKIHKDTEQGIYQDI